MLVVLSHLFLGLAVMFGQVVDLSARQMVQLETPAPVVQALVFWMRGCPNCEQVLNQYLPEVQQHYGDQLELRLVEVKSTQDVDALYQVGKAYGLQKEQIGVPMVIIGNQALVGSSQIPQEFSALVDRYLASGGVAYPDLQKIPTGANSGDVPLQEAAPFSGMTLAAVICAGLILALIFSFWMVIRAFGAARVPAPASWLNLAIPILSILGLGVALYLTYIEVSSAQAICGPVGDCNAVQKSIYAKVLGIIPVGLIGAAGYLAILAAWLWGRFRSDRLAGYVPVVIWGMATFGTIYSVYLTYLEIFVIKAVCIWCLTSAVIITITMLASLPGCMRWVADVEED